MSLPVDQYDYLVKLVVIGDAGVGKSCLVSRFADPGMVFCESHICTIGVDFRLRTIKDDGATIKCQIWDTAGQERFRTISRAYYRGAHGIVFVYSADNPESFAGLEGWLQEVKDVGDIPKFVIANKSDLCDDIEPLLRFHKSWAAHHGMPWIAASAKTGTNVDTAFRELMRSCVGRHLYRESQKLLVPHGVPLSQAARGGSSCAC